MALNFSQLLGDMKGNAIERHRTYTTTPEQTMVAVLEILKSFQSKYDIKALGLGCFGPIDVDLNSPTYGYITNTPKVAWQNFDIVSSIRLVCNGPLNFDTDVNAAALCEQLWGAGHGFENLLYLTIGTGIGGGAICNNRIVQGATHTELGHIGIAQNPDDTFKGSCPFHSNCLEGLASGTAVNKRWEVSSASKLADDHIAWQFEAEYLAKAITSFVFTLSPEKVILGGGIMHKTVLFDMIRFNLKKYINNYFDYPALQDMSSFVVPASFGDNTGVKGSLALALQALK